MTNHNPRAAFPEFYSNPIISTLAESARWTVSDNEKVPINMRALIDNDVIWGAHEISDRCLVPLDELVDFLPNAANNAYYLRAQTDGVLVLDIEKTCPPEVSRELLKIPNSFVEESMSGRGYHLVLPLPANFWDYPIAAGKRVLREEHGWYEILLDHWVTFTRRTVPADRLPVPDYSDDHWANLYASLASLAVDTSSSDLEVSSEQPEIPRLEQILDLMTRRGLDKSPADFHHDHSRFEFSTLGMLFNRLKPIVPAIVSVEPHMTFDAETRAWIIYLAASRLVPRRDKHDEIRNGMPLLLNAAVELVGRRMADEGSTASTSN